MRHRPDMQRHHHRRRTRRTRRRQCSKSLRSRPDDGEGAFAIIRAAAERLAALAPPGQPRPPALMMALHIWSMSHGVASLFARGDAARRKLPMTAEDLLEAEVLIYLRGLGFSTERKPSASAAEPMPAGQTSAPPPVPSSGPWGTQK